MHCHLPVQRDVVTGSHCMLFPRQLLSAMYPREPAREPSLKRFLWATGAAVEGSLREVGSCDRLAVPH